MNNSTQSRRVARTSTFPRAFAHPSEYYREPLTPRVRDEAVSKPFGWGLIREEQLGCQVTARLLSADVGIEGKRKVRSSVAKALYSTACFGFNNSSAVLHISGPEPSYRNIRLPRLDLVKTGPEERQAEVVGTLDGQIDRNYPAILRSIEAGRGLKGPRLLRNARILGQCSLELTSIPLLELELPFADNDVQDFVAMSANNLKIEVAREIAETGTTPSVRQFVHRSSPVFHELMSSTVPEVSDLALDILRDI